MLELMQSPLENLPFENGDADLFSFLDGLQPNVPMCYDTTGSKGVGNSQTASLSQAPSWGLSAVGSAFDPADGVNIASEFQRRQAATAPPGLPGAEAMPDMGVAQCGAGMQLPDGLGLPPLSAAASEGFALSAGQWSMQDTFHTPSALAGYPNLQIHSMHTSVPAGAAGLHADPLSTPCNICH